jgi:HEAT repeat protein
MTVERLVRQIRGYPAADHSAAVERLSDHDDPELWMQAVEVAARLGHPRLVELCVRLLADPVWYVRCSACERAYLAPVAVPADVLLGLVEANENETVRFYAAMALGRVADEQHLPRIAQLAEFVSGCNHEGVTVRDRLLRSALEVWERGGRN